MSETAQLTVFFAVLYGGHALAVLAVLAPVLRRSR